MVKSIYNKLKTDLGFSDAVNEYTEVLLRKFESEEPTEEAFQKIASKFNIRVNDIAADQAIAKIRGYYIVSVYQVAEYFFEALKSHINKFSNPCRHREDGEAMLKYIYFLLLDMRKTKEELYLYYLICDYYRLVRNFNAHIEEPSKIERAYQTLKNRQTEISDIFPKLQAPNNYDSITFDDFVLYSRALKKLGRIFVENVDYDLDKVAESINLKKYSKIKNSKNRVRASLRFEIKTGFSLDDVQVESVVEKLMIRM